MPLKRTLAWIGAAVAVLCGMTILWEVVAIGRDFYPLFMTVLYPGKATGSGGLGGVSVEAAGQVSVAILGLLPAVVVNRRFASRAREAHGRLRSLYRLHSALLLMVGGGVILLALGIPFGAFLSIPGMFAVGLLTLAAVGVQFFVLAGLLLRAA